MPDSMYAEPSTGLFGEPVPVPAPAAEIIRRAEFAGPGDIYRPVLSRIWDENKPLVVFVGLNPSTADAFVDDPTIAKEIRMARAWGFGGLIMLNVFAYRSTDPAALLTVPDPVGPGNLEAIRKHASGRPVICAWGRVNKRLAEHAQRVRDLLVDLSRGGTGTALNALGYTKDGQPRHPLYVPDAAKLVPFPPPRAPEPSTAQSGDPGNATRGAAVDRARADLGFVIDARLALDVEQMEIDLLSRTSGIPADQMRQRLAAATLAELTDWAAAINETLPE